MVELLAEKQMVFLDARVALMVMDFRADLRKEMDIPIITSYMPFRVNEQKYLNIKLKC